MSLPASAARRPKDTPALATRISRDTTVTAAFTSSDPRGSGRSVFGSAQNDELLPSHQKCKKALSKRKVVFLQGSVHFNVSCWKGSGMKKEIQPLNTEQLKKLMKRIAGNQVKIGGLENGPGFHVDSLTNHPNKGSYKNAKPFERVPLARVVSLGSFQRNPTPVPNNDEW